MRCALILLLCFVAFGCHREPPSRAELHAWITRVYDANTAGRYGEADSLAEAYMRGPFLRATGDPYAGKVAGHVLYRQAFARWEMGDTTGSVRSYSRAFHTDGVNLDTLRGVAYTHMAYVAGQIDLSNGIRMMDEAEDAALEAQDTPNAILAARCKLALLERADSLHIAIAAPPVTEEPGKSLAIWFAAVMLAGMGVWALWEAALTEWNRVPEGEAGSGTLIRG